MQQLAHARVLFAAPVFGAGAAGAAAAHAA